MSEQMNQMLSDSGLPLYEKAVVFAAIAHQGAHRKGSRIPYLSHPIEAAAIVSELTDDEELIAAAVLHDVVEDTPVTLEEVEQYFGERIAAYVGYETEDKRRDLPAEETWLVRKQEMLTFLRDKAERDVTSIGDQVWERFHQKDKKMHGWLYRQTAEVLRELEEYPAWKEYDRLIRRVFHEDLI